MIDIYLKDKSLKCEKYIQECYNYYSETLETYDDIYDEYDRINHIKPKKEINDKNIFFKNGKLNKIDTKFMKECLLESLKRFIEDKTIQESKDKNSELNSDIQTYMKGSNKYTNHFYTYPDIYENDIPDKLFQKEEFKRHIISNEQGNIQDKCGNNFFELAPHQVFLKNFMSPTTQYYGLLIFHGVGVGKSCSGISIAENFRDIYGKEENKIIILASKNIRIGWKKTIFDPNKGDNQCTGDQYYYDDIDDKQIDDKYVKRKIKKYYELYGYAAFANSVKKLLKKSTNHLSDEKEILKKQIQIIKDTYSNRVLIIDEVHNIRGDEESNDSRDTIYYIEMVIKYSQKMRLILLTANPMYNLSTEIIWILNMLLLNDNRPTLSEKDIFDKDGNIKNENLLIDKSKGYISYLRGENPISFPIRLYPNHSKENIINSSNSHLLNIFKNEILEENKLSFLELYSSKLIDHQLKIYLSESSKLIGDRSIKIDNENILLQLSNIVYPGDSDNYNDLYGDNGLINTMNINKGVYSYKSETLDNYGEYFHKDNINKYSSKIYTILNEIKDSDGIVFIYSNWIKSGIVPLVLALEQNGYTRTDKKEVLKGSKGIEKISYEGKYLSEYNDKKDFKSANYLVISGSELNSNHLEEELKRVASDENINGEIIKIVIGSSVASEGLDFKNIRSIHILEPWHNINKLEQVIGRGIRNCSHKKLDEKNRNVTIYLHASEIDDNETIDTYLYRYSEHKAKQIGKIENILKSNSIDKYIFKNGNYFGPNDISDIVVQPCFRKSKSIKYNLSDKKYSRVCSFSEICNYMEKDKITNYNIPEKNKYDTFQIKYSESIVNIYKKRIHNLYLSSVCFTYDELKNNLSEYKEIYTDYLNYALKEMIFDKYILHNSNGDKGYLVRINKYYVFQPYYNNDILLPVYYRLNKGDINHISYDILPKEKIKNTFLYEKHKFTDEIIMKTYLKLINFEFKEHEKKVFQYLNLDIQNPITISYIFDRLSIEDKYILGYIVLLYLKEGELLEDIDETIIQNCIFSFEKLFIYYDTKFYYSDQFKRGSEKDIVGFMLYYNIEKKPLFYNYENREIEIFNKVDEIDIVLMIKKNQKSKHLSMNGSWGFTTYSERIKFGDPKYTHNGIVLKVIKSTDKLKKNYVYPSGPGIIIQDQATGAWIGESTYQFIVDEFKDILDSLKSEIRETLEMKNTKRDYVCFIELCLRIKNKFIQNDLIFMKYY